MHTDTCPRFLAPCGAEEFRTRYLDRNMLVQHRCAPAHFRDMFDLEQIDSLVTSVRIPATNLNLAMGDAPLPMETYCAGGAYVDKAKVLDLHEQGATIILRSVEQWSGQLQRLRIEAEEFFGCECQINAYLTPPGQKSTPPHWDTHDLVVMQLAGRKTWRLYGGRKTLPLGDERFQIGRDFVSDGHHDVVLEAGDSLYLPRGFIHEPVADSYSVHLSIGVNVIRWHDVLELALRLVAEQEGNELRTSIGPAGTPLAFPSEAALAQLTAPMTIARAAALLREQSRKRKPLDLEGRLLQFAAAATAPVTEAMAG